MIIKIWKNLIVIASILILINVTLFPICVGNKTELINQIKYKSISEDKTSTKVAIYTFTSNGIKTVKKEIPMEKWKEFTNHISNIDEEYKDKYVNIREKINLFTNKLNEFNFLSNNIDLIRILDLYQDNSIRNQYFSNILKNSQINDYTNEGSRINFFNLIYGEGRNGICIDLKNTITIGSLRQLVLLRLLFMESFNGLFILLTKRPRAMIGYGIFEMIEGGEVNTYGLNGIKNINCEDCSIFVTLQFFIGFIICSFEESYICGFSITSGLYS
jgi:hypothetical protein